LFALRDLNGAERMARNTLKTSAALVTLDPGNRSYRMGLATAHSSMGLVHINAGQLEETAASFRAAVQIREQLVEEEPDNVEFRRDLLVGLGNLGDILGFRTGENLGDATYRARNFGSAPYCSTIPAKRVSPSSGWNRRVPAWRNYWPKTRKTTATVITPCSWTGRSARRSAFWVENRKQSIG
jgi:hypothetical protein